VRGYVVRAVGYVSVVATFESDEVEQGPCGVSRPPREADLRLSPSPGYHSTSACHKPHISHTSKTVDSVVDTIFIPCIMYLQKKGFAMWYPPSSPANLYSNSHNNTHPHIEYLQLLPRPPGERPPSCIALRTLLKHIHNTLQQLLLILAHLHLQPQ
jgi:hypothetical protein